MRMAAAVLLTLLVLAACAPPAEPSAPPLECLYLVDGVLVGGACP
jgi:hypothetical protein